MSGEGGEGEGRGGGGEGEGEGGEGGGGGTLHDFLACTRHRGTEGYLLSRGRKIPLEWSAKVS